MYVRSVPVDGALQEGRVTTVWLLFDVSLIRSLICDSARSSHVLSKYKVSSRTSPSSIFVSPPKTMKALPTSKLAWPTLGPGPSEVVATG